MPSTSYGQAEERGPYVFDSAQEARSFVESSLVALRVLGCEVA